MAYSKLHSSIVNSSLWVERDSTRLLFITLLALCDRDGMVYGSRGGLSRVANIEPDDIDEAWANLMAPDPDSSDKHRSPEHEGRRVEEVSGGYRLLNFAYYRGLRNDDDRREQNREAQARFKAKVSQGKPPKATVSHEKPPKAHTETDAEAEEEKKQATLAGARPAAEPPPPALVETPKPKAPPDCPHLDVLALWAEVLPHLPQHDAGQWRGSRSDHLRARWRESATSKGWADQAQGLAYLRKLFGYVGQSPFLNGKEHSQGRRPFFAELAWLVEPLNWAKTIEGKYHPMEHTA